VNFISLIIIDSAKSRLRQYRQAGSKFKINLMENLLYYPYINLPRTDWTIRTLLYYQSIGSIVPQEYFYNPDGKYEPFMLQLMQASLVKPINPMDVLDRPWEVTKPFIEHISKNKEKIEKAQHRFRQGKFGSIHSDKFRTARIHADKFDENIFYSLQQLGLAEPGQGQWYSVETKTADQLMKFLATLIGFKTNRLPTTDYIRPRFYKPTFITQQKKRETILTRLIPFPEQLDLNKVLRFKETHHGILEAFRNRVEIIVLDPSIEEGTQLFDEKVQELEIRKQELSAKMNESQLGNIIFGTVCGIIGAFQGLATANTTSAFFGGLPGFATAIHSALKIENAEKVFDQSGLKYLALADKRLLR
jgi:hypothetical protein